MAMTTSKPLEFRSAKSKTEILSPGRVSRVAKEIARALRKGHLTPEEARQAVKQARALAGIRGRSAKAKRLPEILTPEELGRVLAQAYRERPETG